MSSAAPTNSCAMRGATAREALPQAPSFTGTSRQPSTCLALGLDALLEQSHGLGRVAGREEADGHAVAARLGELEAGLGAEEGVGQLDQDPRAVPGVRVGALGAAVLEPLERVQRSRHDLVRGGRADPCDEGDAAGVVLVARVVQATRCLQCSTS